MKTLNKHIVIDAFKAENFSLEGNYLLGSDYGIEMFILDGGYSVNIKILEIPLMVWYYESGINQLEIDNKLRIVDSTFFFKNNLKQVIKAYLKDGGDFEILSSNSLAMTK